MIEINYTLDLFKNRDKFSIDLFEFLTDFIEGNGTYMSHYVEEPSELSEDEENEFNNILRNEFGLKNGDKILILFNW